MIDETQTDKTLEEGYAGIAPSRSKVPPRSRTVSRGLFHDFGVSWRLFGRTFPSLVCLTVLVSAGVGLAATASKYKTVPEKEVNVQQRDRARTLASHILTKWLEGKYEPFPDDFDDEVKKISTPEAQKKAADRIKELFGDYKGLEYAETVTSPVLPGVVFYRFKGTFSRAKEKPEVLVVFDATGKITGIWVKPWEKDAH